MLGTSIALYYLMMTFELYRLPLGRIVSVDASASKGAPEIEFTLADGRIVTAVKVTTNQNLSYPYLDKNEDKE